MSATATKPDGLAAYVAVTAAYWAFMLSDGALRMLVLLHFHSLGFSPVQLAWLFLLYEMGVVEVREVKDAPSTEKDPAQLFEEGKELLSRHRYREAIAVFQEVLRLDPQNMWADEQIEKLLQANVLHSADVLTPMGLAKEA